jgi:polysaccharide export outer membrane protein
MLPASPRHATARSVTTWAIFICLILGSCSSGSSLAPLPVSPPGPYRLSVGDQVRIITFGQGGLSGQFAVNDRGIIDLPLLGGISADNETTSGLSSRIESKLRDAQILLDPSVSVEIVAYRPIFILGEVSKPGQYPYQPGMTLLTAVAIAGGFTYRAETHDAAMLRKVDGRTVEGRVSRETEVLPGDVITILERYF